MKQTIRLSALLFLASTLSLSLANAQYSNDQESFFSKNQKFDHEGVELYDSNIDMKEYKKIGVGFSSGGMTGLFGLNLEINIVPQDSAVVGLGKGEAYGTFHFAWKRNYEGQYLSPYTKVGYSRWFNTNSDAGAANESNILKNVLTESEIRTNEFSADFIAAAAGLEYNQLEGELSGVNFYGELILMSEITKSIYLPTAGVGLTYFY